MKSYKLKNWKPIKMVSQNKGNTIDDNGNGWYNQNLDQFIKISWQKENGKLVAIEGATQDEIDAYHKQKQQEQFQQFKQKLQNDGQLYYNEIDLKITMRFFGRPQSEINQLVAEVDAKIMPVMELVKSGQWYSALMKILNTELPTNAEVLQEFDEVKDYIVNYVQTNYK